MDPELKGPDPIWKFLLSGKAHIYYSTIAIVVLAVIVDAGGPRWLCVVIAALAAAIFSDAWAHQFLH